MSAARCPLLRRLIERSLQRSLSQLGAAAVAAVSRKPRTTLGVPSMRPRRRRPLTLGGSRNRAALQRLPCGRRWRRPPASLGKMRSVVIKDDAPGVRGGSRH